MIIGAKSQALLSYQIIAQQGHTAPYVFDQDRQAKPPPWECVLFREEELIEEYARKCDGFLVCMGNVGRGLIRIAFGRRLEQIGLQPISAIHPSAYIAETAKIGHGLQTSPRAVVGDFTSIGDYCIVGINAAIDHECNIGNGCHVMGGAAISGDVTLKDGVDIGANATVLPHVAVGERCIVGAGSVVLKDVPQNSVVGGVPAKLIRNIA